MGLRQNPSSGGRPGRLLGRTLRRQSGHEAASPSSATTDGRASRACEQRLAVRKIIDQANDGSPSCTEDVRGGRRPIRRVSGPSTAWPSECRQKTMAAETRRDTTQTTAAWQTTMATLWGLARGPSQAEPLTEPEQKQPGLTTDRPHAARCCCSSGRTSSGVMAAMISAAVCWTYSRDSASVSLSPA